MKKTITLSGMLNGSNSLLLSVDIGFIPTTLIVRSAYFFSTEERNSIYTIKASHLHDLDSHLVIIRNEDKLFYPNMYHTIEYVTSELFQCTLTIHDIFDSSYIPKDGKLMVELEFNATTTS